MSKNRIRTDFAIVGGGASGLACAITLKRELPASSVTVIEKLHEPGKKILVTGNGRCNLSNTYIAGDCYDGDEKIVRLVTENFGTADCLEFFDSLGLKTSVEDGRIYPMSMSASAVRTLLIDECERLGVEIHSENRVTEIEKTLSGFIITAQSQAEEKTVFECSMCVLACGGKAAAAHGTDGDGYKLLKSLGIRYEPISPALVQIKAHEPFLKQLKGVRVHGAITLLTDDAEKSALCERGEILFTDYGVSGIPAMQLSGKVAVLTSGGKTAKLVVDLCPDLIEEEIRAQRCLIGIIHEKSAAVVSQIASESGKDTAHIIKNFTLTATGTNSYKDAQVTHGGAGSAVLKPDSLEAANVPGLFICGELLNADGKCGGYNLHFAWGSGILAAKEAVRLAQNK